MKDGKLPGNRVSAVTKPSWNGTSGSKMAQATNDATKETGGSAITASPAQSVPRPKVPIPNHEVGQNGS